MSNSYTFGVLVSIYGSRTVYTGLGNIAYHNTTRFNFKFGYVDIKKKVEYCCSYCLRSTSYETPPSQDSVDPPPAQSRSIPVGWSLLSEKATWADPSSPCERSAWPLWRLDSEV